MKCAQHNRSDCYHCRSFKKYDATFRSQSHKRQRAPMISTLKPEQIKLISNFLKAPTFKPGQKLSRKIYRMPFSILKTGDNSGIILQPTLVAKPTKRAATKIAFPISLSAEGLMIQSTQPLVVKIIYYKEVGQSLSNKHVVLEIAYGEQVQLIKRRQLPNTNSAGVLNTEYLKSVKYYQIMPHIPGINLQTYIQQRQGKIDCQQAVAISIKLLKEVSRYHTAGWLHCDIKPANIMYKPDKQLQLIDPDDAVKQRRAHSIYRLLGTYPYYRKGRSAHQSAFTITDDFHAVGITIIELFTGGHLAEESEYLKQFEAKHPKTSAGRMFFGIIMRLINSTFRSCEEAIDALGRIDLDAASVCAVSKYSGRSAFQALPAAKRQRLAESDSSDILVMTETVCPWIDCKETVTDYNCPIHGDVFSMQAAIPSIWGGTGFSLTSEEPFVKKCQSCHQHYNGDGCPSPSCPVQAAPAAVAAAITPPVPKTPGQSSFRQPSLTATNLLSLGAIQNFRIIRFEEQRFKNAVEAPVKEAVQKYISTIPKCPYTDDDCEIVGCELHDLCKTCRRCYEKGTLNHCYNSHCALGDIILTMIKDSFWQRCYFCICKSGCGGSFTTKTAFSKHLEYHQAGPQQQKESYSIPPWGKDRLCPYEGCEQICESQSNYEKHYLSHITSQYNRMYKCENHDFCGFSSNNPGDIKRHKKRCNFSGNPMPRRHALATVSIKRTGATAATDGFSNPRSTAVAVGHLANASNGGGVSALPTFVCVPAHTSIHNAMGDFRPSSGGGGAAVSGRLGTANVRGAALTNGKSTVSSHQQLSICVLCKDTKYIEGFPCIDCL